MFIRQVYAQITNPALSDSLTSDPASGFAQLLAALWRTIIVIGGMAILVFLAWGGIQWITAGGDKQKVEQSRNRIINAFIGMALLGASVAIMYFIQFLFGIDLLNPTFYGVGVPE